jgi:hypothetical protein
VNSPRTIFGNPDAVQRHRADAASVRPAIDALVADATRSMSTPAYSVMDKAIVPPSGNKHDYISLAKYWWPDPANPGGPYTRRDGQINPEWETYDRVRMWDFTDAATALAQAAYFTGRDDFAQRAAMLVRTWFLDDATRMNPHVKYAQFVPGVVEGRPMGIIDMAPCTELLDAMALLAASHPNVWTLEDERGLRHWFANFAQWLIESDFGKEEAASPNNHGNWYDVQLVYYLLYLARDEQAAQILRARAVDRMINQIEPDGRQPQELARTLAFGYSVFNLLGFAWLAVMGQRVGVDLWSYESSDGRSLKRAIDWLLPYCQPGATWPYQQIVPFTKENGETHRLVALLRLAGAHYQDAKYEQVLRTRTDLEPQLEVINLLVSPPISAR